MDDRDQQRKIRHRLAMLRHAAEVTGSVAQTCRYYGISRQCFYKWLRRYEEMLVVAIWSQLPHVAHADAADYST
ncbi:MAG: helix-turn-helix domain-containing protein [Acidimicrobiia bacterium]